MGKKLSILFTGLSGFILGFAVARMVKHIAIDNHIPFELAQPIFDAIVQVNATIIGFWGIILVYYLKVLFDNRREEINYYQRIMEKIDEMEHQNQPDEERIDFWENIMCQTFDVIGILDNKIRNHIFVGVIVVVFFILSIFSSILFIGHPPHYNIHENWLIIPIISLLFGIWNMFFGIWLTSPNPKTSEETAKEIRIMFNQKRRGRKPPKEV